MPMPVKPTERQWERARSELTALGAHVSASPQRADLDAPWKENRSVQFMQATDADMRDLAKLGGLERLSLGDTNVGDAGLEHVADLRRLTSLDIWQTKVTDAGMQQLVRLPRLRQLFLSWNRRLTDAGMPFIAR